MLTKHAKTISKKQQDAVLAYLSTSRNPTRNRVMAMLSFLSGLRAIEIKRLTWSSVLNSDNVVSDTLEIYNSTSKGGRNGSGGRVVPMHPELKAELELLFDEQENVSVDLPVIQSTRTPGKGMSGNGVTVWFKRLFDDLGINASSHSGRRSFATSLSKKVDVFTLRDCMGHSSIQTTMLYVNVNSEEKAKAIASL
jgi:integrase/recombinase XerD